jgi:hypothetical protein
LETTLSRRIAFPIRCDIIIIIYRIVSRALALFYFYLPPRLSFSLLLKRTTNTLSSFRGGKISEEKEEIRENRPENEATFFRKILIKEFHLLKAKRSSSEYAYSRTHREHSKHPNDVHFARSIGTRSVVLIFSALTFCAFAHGCAVYQKKVSGGRNFRSVDRIFVSVSHVRRAQSSRLDEVPNFLERRSASQSVLFTIFRNSDIDAYRACGE